jgi:hypothetical protein
MSKTSTIVIVGAFALAPLFALADDRTTSDVSAAEQAQMKQEAVAKKSAFGRMSPEERSAAKKASDAQHLAYENMIEKITQNPGESRNMAINKSAAASKAGPTPPRGTINTPEAEKLLLKQKGQ